MRGPAIILVGAALSLLPVAAFAAVANPVKITSDKFVIDDTQHVATFTGKVVVTRTNLTVWAPVVVVDYANGGPGSIKSFTATGGVRIKTTNQDATGDRADYDPKSQLLKLSGHVMVISASGSVGSPDLVVDLTTNVSVFTGGKSGRVTGVFNPQ